MGKKKIFQRKKRRLPRKNTRSNQQPPLLPEEVKHIVPTDILGTSGTGKAMEPWHEEWFLHSSPADGGKKWGGGGVIMLEHTHMRCSS